MHLYVGTTKDEVTGVMEETDTIKRAQSGSHQAFDLLVDRYYHMVYGIASRMSGNAVDADELTHDIFVGAYLKLGQLKNHERFGGWLKILAMNTCRMWIRRRQRMQTVPLNDDLLVSVEEPGRGYGHIYSGMSRLTATHRMVLALHYFEGLPYADIARFLDVPSGTVMSRLSRARKLLKEEIQMESADGEHTEIADIRFKEEIQAEVALLLSMKGIKSTTGTRLKAVFKRSPERLARLLDDASDSILHNLAIVLPRLSADAYQAIFRECFSGTPLRADRARVVLREYIKLCEPESVPGAEHNMASYRAYELAYHLLDADMPTSNILSLLMLCAEEVHDQATRALFISTMCLYADEAFELLWGLYLDDSNRGEQWVKHALTRFGTRLLNRVAELIHNEQQELLLKGLAGFELIARSMKHPWSSDASAQKLNHERRIAVRYPAISPNELDDDLLRSTNDRIAALTECQSADVREQCIKILAILKDDRYFPYIRQGLVNGTLSTRICSIRAVGEVDDAESVSTLTQMLNKGSIDEQLACLEALGAMGAVDAVPDIAALVHDPHEAVRATAVAALGGIASAEAKLILSGLIATGDAAIRKLAAKAYYGGDTPRQSQPSEVQRRLAEKRKRMAQPVCFISLDAVMRYGLPELRSYDEKELTERIACVCEDYCAARRYLVEFRLMVRDNGRYSFTPLGERMWHVEQAIMKGVAL
ncbi:MAG: sigma-70 family RNA polymerase sigma factor [Armatimonadota bacterium]